MAVRGLQAAKLFCELRDWQLTNLALNKLIYIAHMFFLGRQGEALVSENFEAWSFGPVLPPVYNRAKAFGSHPVRNVFTGVKPIDVPEARNMIEMVAERFGRLPASTLVSITHSPDGAWAQHYDSQRRHIVIPNDDIRREYERRAGRKQ